MSTLKIVVLCVVAVVAVLCLPILVFCIPDVKQLYRNLKNKITQFWVKHAVRVPAKKEIGYV